MAEYAEGFETFVAIADEGSLAGAARVLGIPRETVSRRLVRLENRLGVRLAHRTTRRLDLTPAGARLAAAARDVVRIAERACEEVSGRGAPRGRVRVSVPPGVGAAFLAEVSAAFCDRYPDVRVELFASSRYVDIASEGFDVALRAGRVEDERLVSRRLWSRDSIAVASRGYVAAHGHPEDVDALAVHRCIPGMAGGVRGVARWPLLDGGTVEVRGDIAVNDLVAADHLVACGYGIAFLPRLVVADRLATGDYVQVLPDVIGAESTMSIVFLDRKYLPTRVRAWIDFVVQWADAHPPEAQLSRWRAARRPGGTA